MSTKIELEGDRTLPEPLRSLGIMALLLVSTVLFAAYTSLLLVSWAARHLVPVRLTRRVWDVVAMEKKA